MNKLVMLAVGILLCAGTVLAQTNKGGEYYNYVGFRDYPGDDDGCYSATNDCFKITGKHSAHVAYSGEVFVIEFDNQCQGGIYLRYTIERKDRTQPDEGIYGARHIKKGQQYQKISRTLTGNNRVVYFGSRIPSMGWVCSGKIDAWKKLPKNLYAKDAEGHINWEDVKTAP